MASSRYNKLHFQSFKQVKTGLNQSRLLLWAADALVCPYSPNANTEQTHPILQQ